MDIKKQEILKEVITKIGRIGRTGHRSGEEMELISSVTTALDTIEALAKEELLEKLKKNNLLKNVRALNHVQKLLRDEEVKAS